MSKYLNVRTGGWDSKKEARYGQELELRKKAGEIKDYQRQKTFTFYVNGHRICAHRVDFFVTFPDGRQEVHEVKGKFTMTLDTWRIKRNLFEALYPETKYVVIQ